MTGVTIDHLVATVAFIGAMLLFIGLFTQTLQTAILYQQNRHVSLKASDLLDNILLSPGYPYKWGETNATLSCFGLQKPGTSGYVLSSFALMRLTSLSGEPVEYPRDSGKWYNNISLGPSGYLFIPISDSINYETASRLLGVNGTYGFQLSIAPIVKVSISEYQSNPLILKVEVDGPGFPLSGAALSYYFYRSYKTGNYASIKIFTDTAQTDSAGVAYLNFAFDGASETYTIVVYARLSGLFGLGHYSHRTFTRGGGVMPFVVDYEAGKVYLAHSWDVHDQGSPVPAYAFNATFFILTEDFDFQEWPIANSTGILNYGVKNYELTTLPVGCPGFLLVTYRVSAIEYGISIMPWGIGTLAVSTLFGDNPYGNVWTATDLRQVTVDQLAYQAKITCWSLQGYQIWNPTG
ncbi:MAG: hypothetical protein OEY24_01895 [Candidatus Bathyarchaeota archaeon]|nr:hypothetical protein [Candidatus Bathyarchaeota archaeon]MDH5494442.1 hypothetical protein [Candidatus Bathyarchaeota archaeon]